LAVRTNKLELAQSSLALVKSIELSAIERDMIADELNHVTTLISERETQIKSR
jgi:hypothetical protein